MIDDRPGSGQPNRASRLLAAIERDGAACFWCARAFGPLVVPTTDHLVPRAKGGPSWLANEVAACRRCNSDRGHRGPAAWLEECAGRGWPADAERLRARLDAVAAVIAERGGQRRARAYLDTQRRRLRRNAA